MKLKFHLIIIIIYLIHSFIILRGLLLSEGIIGLKQDWSIPPYKDQLIRRFYENFYLWNDITGKAKVYPSLFYYRMIEALLYPILDYNGEYVSKAVLLVLLTISGYFMFILLYNFNNNLIAAFLAGIVYASSPVIYNRIIAGYLPYILSYSLAPLVLLLFIRALKSSKIASKYSILTGLIMGVAFSQLQFIVMIPFMLFMWLVMFTNKNRIIKDLLIYIFVLMIAVFLHISWIIPGIIKVTEEYIVIQAPIVYHEIRNAPSVFEGLLLVGYPHIYDYVNLIKRGLMDSSWYIFQSLMIILGSLSLLLLKDAYKKIAVYSMVLYIIGVFMAKALNPPLGDLWKWLYINISIMRMFREVYHFMFIPAFSIALLIGLSIGAISIRLKTRVYIRKVIATIIIILVMIPLLHLYQSGNLMGQLATYEFADYYKELYDFLYNKDDDIFRIMYLPFIQPIQYNNASYPGVDPIIMYSAKPTLCSIIDRQDPFCRYSSFIIISLRENVITRISDLLAPLGVKYIIFRPYEYSYFYKYVPITKYGKGRFWNNNTYLEEVVKRQEDIIYLRRIGDLKVYLVNKPLAASYLSLFEYNLLVLGDLRTLIKIPDYDNIGLIYSFDIRKSNISMLDNIINGVVIDDPTPIYSLLLSLYDNIFIPVSEELFPENGWAVENVYWWYNLAITSSVIPTVFTLTSKTLRENIDLELEPTDLIASWNFDDYDDFMQWSRETPKVQFNAIQELILQEGSLKAILWNSTWGWKTIRSPLIEAKHGDMYLIRMKIKGVNIHGAHIKIIELDEEKNYISSIYILNIGSGTFDWKPISFTYQVMNPNTRYFQIQVWHGHETKKPLPNILWIDDVEVFNISRYAEYVKLDIPIRIEDPGLYKLFIRYLENPEGGKIRIYVDNTGFKREIQTLGQLNKFKWEYLGSLYLSKGEYKIFIENIYGFNAINSVALIKEDKYKALLSNIKDLLKDKVIIYVFDAEQDLYKESLITTKNVNLKFNPMLLNYDMLWQNVELIKEDYYRLIINGFGVFRVSIGNYTFIVRADSGYGFTPWFYLDEKNVYKLKVEPLLDVESLIINHSFEEKVDGFPLGWNFENKRDFRVSLDKGYSGKYSLKITTSTTKPKTWSWIRSEPINVTPGSEYLLITHLKYYNVNATHVKVEAYYPDSNKWVSLTPFIPGGISGSSEEWIRYYGIIKIPDNVTKIRVVLNAGWVLDKNSGEATTWFDDIILIPLNKVPVLRSITIISKGNDIIYCIYTNETSDFCNISKPGEIISYKKVDPTRWIIKVNVTRPFMLRFAEAYNPFWEARIYSNGSLIEIANPIQLYSSINGFWINSTGELTIVIRYAPQSLFEAGLKAGLTIIITTIIFYIYIININRWVKRGIGYLRKMIFRGFI